MPEISFIMHKGVKILYEDYSHGKPDELLLAIEKAKEVIASQPLNSVLALVNVKDAHFDTRVTRALKEFAEANKPYIKVAAVYGVEGLKEVIFRGMLAFSGRKNFILCKTLEEAKDFLADQK